MRLRELVERALGVDARELPDLEVRGVAQDSRRVEPGFVFVARRGESQDGHLFAREAIAKGAVAIVGSASLEERQAMPWHGQLPYLEVGDDKTALAKLAATFFGNPSHQLKVAGVTGTDGKTTTATMLHHLLSLSYPTGLMSTAASKIREETLKLPGHFTTPEAPEVQALLARFVEAGVTHAVLESSSHGFAQRRLGEVHYDLGILTNLSPEHLDFHHSFEAYRDAKAELFRRAPLAILNADDANYAYFAGVAKEVISYGVEQEAQWRALDIVEAPGRLEWQLVARTAEGTLELPLCLPMIGRYNVHNALAAFATAHTLGVGVDRLQEGLETFPGVPGRMQVVQHEPFTVVVDFAHTAPALAKALEAVRPQVTGRLMVVIGAAGERDPGKREPLGYTAEKLADLTIFTEEDYRSEKLDKILAQLAAGAEHAGGVRGETFLLVPDRREAIFQAVAMAQAGDLVLLAGKGHEDTLERGREALPWNEVEEAQQALAAKKQTP